jgi:hypothetical protein
MAVITPDTFNALRRYVSVRLQQGVPLVDADWNELDDIRRFEVRTFLKWFVGDGVPEGTNGYRIEATGLANDFFIRSGVAGTINGLSNIGRCLVDGLDVMIDADIRFAAQPLHVTQTGSAALATALGVPQIQAMPAPAANSTVVAYLDVWERLVTPTEDPSLIHAGLGTESCARLKREWAVRVRTGTTVPVTGNSDFIAGHSYYALATIARGASAVNASDVTDQRDRRLLMPPATVISDALGGTPLDYRRGQNRPPVSLRDAINALLRNELPSTPDAPISTAAGVDSHKRGFVFDNANGLVAVWQSARVSPAQLFAARLDLGNPSAGFSAPIQITTGAPGRGDPHVALLPNGDLLVIYTFLASTGTSGIEVFAKRAPFSGLATATETPVGNTGAIEELPTVVLSGDIAVLIYLIAGSPSNLWQYRRRRVSDNTFLDAAAVQLSSTPTVRESHATRAQDGTVFFAFTSTTGQIRTIRLNPTTAATVEEIHEVSTNVADDQPFLMPSATGEMWMFWHATSLHARRFTSGAWGTIETVPITVAGADGDRFPCAVEDASGAIWLFWVRGTPGNGDIYYARRDPVTAIWGQPRLLTSTFADDSAPFTLLAPDQSIWALWSSTRTGDADLFFKRIFTAV